MNNEQKEIILSRWHQIQPEEWHVVPGVCTLWALQPGTAVQGSHTRWACCVHRSVSVPAYSQVKHCSLEAVTYFAQCNFTLPSVCLPELRLPSELWPSKSVPNGTFPYQWTSGGDHLRIKATFWRPVDGLIMRFHCIFWQAIPKRFTVFGGQVSIKCTIHAHLY